MLLCISKAAVAGSPMHSDPPLPPPPEKIVVLHGLGLTNISMLYIVNALRDAGYEVDNIRYHSTRDPLHVLIDEVYDKIDHYLTKTDQTVHFVCYSLGCLITRGIIYQNPPMKLGRVVMLGPPNQGSEMADYLKDHALSNWVFGPILPQLGTANRRMLANLIGTEVPYPVGVIAGKSWINPMGAAIIPGESDGTVAVERTKLPGMQDHIVLDVSHTGMLMDSAVTSQVLEFLKNGQFRHIP